MASGCKFMDLNESKFILSNLLSELHHCSCDQLHLCRAMNFKNDTCFY